MNRKMSKRQLIRELKEFIRDLKKLMWVAGQDKFTLANGTEIYRVLAAIIDDLEEQTKPPES